MPDVREDVAARIQAAALLDLADELEHTAKGQNSSSIIALVRTKASSLTAAFPAPPEKPEEEQFVDDLASVLNKYSRDVASGTPDYILANFLINVLWHFDELMVTRANWRGESLELPALQKLHAARPDIFGGNEEKADGNPTEKRPGLMGNVRRFLDGNQD